MRLPLQALGAAVAPGHAAVELLVGERETAVDIDLGERGQREQRRPDPVGIGVLARFASLLHPHVAIRIERREQRLPAVRVAALAGVDAEELVAQKIVGDRLPVHGEIGVDVPVDEHVPDGRAIRVGAGEGIAVIRRHVAPLI